MVTVTRTVNNASTVKLKQRLASNKRRVPSIYVKLAEESAVSEQNDSDTSTYDSLNEMETGSYMFNSIAIFHAYQSIVYQLENKNKNKQIPMVAIDDFFNEEPWFVALGEIALHFARANCGKQDRALFICNFAYRLCEKSQQ